MLHSKECIWMYEFHVTNNKYFSNLEKRNHRKKHITSLTTEKGTTLLDLKLINRFTNPLTQKTKH